jgi:triosephosphate isomerase
MHLIANWKMNGNKALVDEFTSIKPSHHNVVICPPFTHLDYAQQKLSKLCEIGAQDCHFELSGALTSCVGVGQLKDLKCRYVILGHCELCEDEHVTHKKLKTVLEHGLFPIVCIGETLKEYESGHALDCIKSKRDKIVQNISKDIMWAYEPLWAVGSGLFPDLSHVEKISSLFPFMLYGGSVDVHNVRHFRDVVDGFLIGGASLTFNTFQEIIDALG